jgi:integrase
VINAGREWVQRKYALRQISGKTADNYNFALNAIYAVGVPKTAHEFEDAYIKLLSQGMRPGTVRNIHYWLRAVSRGIGHPMPDEVKPPKAEEGKGTTIHEPDLKRLMNALKSDKDIGCLMRFAIVTGLRRGELVALKWDDFDFVEGTVTVSRSLSRSRVAGSQERGPKTRAGRRTIKLPNCMVAECMSRYTHDNAYAFPNPDGGRRNLNAVTNSVKSILRKHGLERFTLHDLRHAHATLLLRNKENPKAVARRLGHANVRVTLGTYGHVMDQDDTGLAAVADRLMDE